MCENEKIYVHISPHITRDNGNDVSSIGCVCVCIICLTNLHLSTHISYLFDDFMIKNSIQCYEVTKIIVTTIIA